MSNLEIIERMGKMLDEAQQIINAQAQLLALHGIETESGQLEASRAQLLADIERTI